MTTGDTMTIIPSGWTVAECWPQCRDTTPECIETPMTAVVDVIGPVTAVTEPVRYCPYCEPDWQHARVHGPTNTLIRPTTARIIEPAA